MRQDARPPTRIHILFREVIDSMFLPGRGGGLHALMLFIQIFPLACGWHSTSCAIYSLARCHLGHFITAETRKWLGRCSIHQCEQLLMYSFFSFESSMHIAFMIAGCAGLKIDLPIRRRFDWWCCAHSTVACAPAKNV